MDDWNDRCQRLMDSIRVWSSGDEPEPPIGTTVRTAYERSYVRYEHGWEPGPWSWRGLMTEAPLVEVPRV